MTPAIVDVLIRHRDHRLEGVRSAARLGPRLATPDRLERFEQEARAVSALNHPNILTIHDVGRQRDTAYFAMESLPRPICMFALIL